jgi:uncharacterized repeat protein (TIGR01451 family)
VRVPPAPVGAPSQGEPPTPTVTIHVQAPAAAAPGQELEYRICVENTSRAAAHHVTVRNPLPARARFARATPKPDQTDPELLWRLGTLEACACRKIVLVLVPSGGGDVENCARVQFEHGQCVTTRISRPQLVLRKTGPTEASVGDALAFRITVTNTGAADATNVVLVEKFMQGWQYAQEPFEKDRVIEKKWELRTIAAGQSQTVEYQATPRVAGRLCTSAEATAAGGLVSEPARHCVQVGQRLLTLEIEGPRTASVRRPVNYFLTVKNEGTVPATDVIVSEVLPPGLEFLDANQGGRYMDGRVSWDLRTLGPGQSRVLRLRVQSDAEREVRQTPVAAYGQGLQKSAELTTTFRGPVGLDFDVEASEYAVEVGSPVRYTITVFNRGAGAQTNTRIVMELPPEMEYRSAQGPGGVKSQADRGIITFEPLPTLTPEKDAVYTVDAVARRAGAARARVGLAAGPAERFTYKSLPIQVGDKPPP